VTGIPSRISPEQDGELVAGLDRVGGLELDAQVGGTVLAGEHGDEGRLAFGRGLGLEAHRDAGGAGGAHHRAERKEHHEDEGDEPQDPGGGMDGHPGTGGLGQVAGLEVGAVGGVIGPGRAGATRSLGATGARAVGVVALELAAVAALDEPLVALAAEGEVHRIVAVDRAALGAPQGCQVSRPRGPQEGPLRRL
jgi:hypothetical protein